MGMDAKRLITELGGITATAKLFHIRPPSVAQWAAEGKIPGARLQTLEALALVREDIAAALRAAGHQPVIAPPGKAAA